MKTIIAGSRGVQRLDMVKDAIRRADIKISEVVSGGARGVDRLGEIWARQNKVPIKVFPANWRKHNRYAGILRNARMANYADALIAVWDGESRGTKNMIQTATEKGLVVFVYRV